MATDTVETKAVAAASDKADDKTDSKADSTHTRLGVFGGAFDPVHRAHIAIAKAARSQFVLNRVLLMPTGNPAHRPRSKTAAKHRLRMLELAIAGDPELIADTTDMHSSGTAYTYDSLRSLQSGNDAEIFLIIGQDSLDQFTGWYRWRDILDLCHLCVARRPGSGRQDLAPALAGRVTEFDPDSRHPVGRIFYLDIEASDISSTRVRECLKQHSKLNDTVAPEVMQYIRENDLYQYD